MTGKRLLVLLVLAGVGLISLLFLLIGYENTWRLWNIPALMPPFFDLRLITGSAESYAAGYDPAYRNPFDPGRRLFNYPRIWYAILALPIRLDDTILIGTLLVIAFFASILLFVKDIDRRSAAVMAAIIFSPAILLGVERANVDLLFFILLALALYIHQRSKIASFLVLMLSVIFKIFPIFSLAYFLEQNEKKSVRWALAGVGIFILYFLRYFKQMLYIFQSTQKGEELSYGTNVVARRLAQQYLGHMDLVSLFFALLGIVVLLVALLGAFRNRGQLPVKDGNHLMAFRAGAGIYIGTFLLGNNWDYRLIFLLFTLPQLVDWLQERGSLSARVVKLSMITLFLSCWYLMLQKIFVALSVRPYVVFYFDEFFNWLLFAGLAFLFLSTLPGWLYAPVDALRARLASRRPQEPAA